MDILILRLIHIGAGVFWVGSVFTFFLFVQPAAAAVGPDATKFTYRLLHYQRLSVAILSAAIVTVLAGATLLVITSNGLKPETLFSASAWDSRLVGMIAILTLAVGGLYVFPRTQVVERTIGRLVEEGRPPSPDEQQLLARTVRQSRTAGWIVIVGLTLAVICMATASYWVVFSLASLGGRDAHRPRLECAASQFLPRRLIVPIAPDIRAEAERLTEEIAAAGLGIRLMGGMAVWLVSPSARIAPFAREYADLDFAVRKADSRTVTPFLERQGLRSGEALQLDPRRTADELRASGWALTIDVIIDELRMSHLIDLRGRLDPGHPTIDLADLLLTKLQVWEINAKDFGDVTCLLADHALGESGADGLRCD
jgi:uncharacterized membrane protein